MALRTVVPGLASAPPHRTRTGVADLVALTRPRLLAEGLLLVLLSFLVAQPVPSGVARFACLLLASALVLGGASVLNQVLERGPDGQMRRTADRPLPAGRVTLRAAQAYGLALLALGLAGLWLGVNPLSAIIAVIGLVLYLALYTPLKRFTSLSTVLGAAPGALPVLMGWSGARGALDAGTWMLFAVVFLWQLPHFLAIGWIHRADYRRAGFRTLAGDDTCGASTARQIASYSLALVPVSLVPSVVGLTGPVYFVGALLLGLAYLAIGLRAGLTRSGADARRLLRVSVVYLPLILSLMAVDRWH